MVENFLNAIINRKPMPISFEDIKAVRKASFAALESLKTGQPIKIQS